MPEEQIQQMIQRYAILVNSTPSDENLKTMYQLSDEQLEKSAKGRLKLRLKHAMDVIDWWNKQYSAVTTLQKRFEKRDCSFEPITIRWKVMPSWREASKRQNAPFLMSVLIPNLEEKCRGFNLKSS